MTTENITKTGDLTDLSLAQLQKLQARIAKEFERRQNTSKKDLLKKMHELAAACGMSMEEVLSLSQPKAAAPAEKTTRAKKTAAKKPAKKVPVFKFRHPEDAAIGWTGHGRKPGWVIDWLQAGKPLDELRMEAVAAETV